ncbi:MAG: hypothetical protein KDA41_09440, partial [Planctomycetales bacterium]|nr:hypothetical protein [Planctomycetales bacterium]
MPHSQRIASPDDPQLHELADELRKLGNTLDDPDAWVGRQLALCGERGVFEWFLPVEVGGQGWSEADKIREYLQLSAACLSTTFVITQR